MLISRPDAERVENVRSSKLMRRSLLASLNSLPHLNPGSGQGDPIRDSLRREYFITHRLRRNPPGGIIYINITFGALSDDPYF